MSSERADRLPEPGDVYAGFRIERLLGAGSFAAVYEASAPAYPGPIALKLSRTPVVSEEVALRALREIGVMRRLTSEHVTRILDHGLGPDERWYVVMEFLEGAPLSDTHDFDVPMAPRRAVDVIHQACMGLDEAHQAGIVHRDIKPDNLWIQKDGSVKVLDFGLARAWDADTTIASTATVGHMLIGTPHYAQPEQIASGRLTPASDVYSLGIILYELLCGRAPLFPDEPLSVVRERLIDEPLQWLLAHVKNEVVPLTHYHEAAQLPHELVEVVHTCLAKDPADRFAGAGALANRLGWIAHHHFGSAAAAIVEIRSPSGERRHFSLVPGSHRVGFSSRCDIALAKDPSGRVHAILDWVGAPRAAELRPLRNDGSVRVNGVAIRGRTPIRPDDVIGVARFELRVRTPV